MIAGHVRKYINLCTTILSIINYVNSTENNQIKFDIIKNDYFYTFKRLENINSHYQCVTQSINSKSYTHIYYKENKTCLIGRVGIPNHNHINNANFYRLSNPSYLEGNYL